MWSGLVGGWNNAWARAVLTKGAQSAQLTVEVHLDHLARLDLANEICPDYIERNTLAGEQSCIAQMPHHQRANAERIAAGDHSLRRHNNQGKGTLHQAQGVDQFVDQCRIAAGRNKVDDDFGIGRGLKDGTT